MKRKLVLRIVATIAAVLVIAAACGGDDDGGSTTAPPPAPEPAAPAPEPEPAAPAPEPAPEPAAPAPEPAAPEPEPAAPEPAAPAPEPEEAAPEPAGGSSAPGVSATAIKLGAISDDGLPLPEIVTIPVVASAIAMFDAVNDEGGVHGRKISVTNCDAAGDVVRARACFRKLVDEDQVFGFITSITWGTGELHQDLARDEVPWFGSWGFFTSEWRDPWMFPTHMATIHEAHANSIWVRDNLDPETVGIIYLNIPEDRLAANAMHDIFDPAGIEVIIEQPIEIETPDHTPAVIEMQAANPDHVIHFAWAAPMAGWMIAAEQQGYWPPLGVSGNHFAAEALGEFVGDWPLKGMWTITTFKVWNDNTEYLAALEKYNPETVLKIHHITQSGYAGARVFIETAKQVGPDITRENMMEAWESQPWDAGPGLGITFVWGDSSAERAAGSGETAAHDNLRCEYQFKYNQSAASTDFAVWIPAPEQYEICDDFD